jgi:hypothetical protein
MTKTMLRPYKAKDVDMLITAATITQAAIANKEFLISKRTTWADPFFGDLQIEIEKAIQTHLGIDSAKALREASQVVYSIQSNAIKDLAEVKVQLIEDFKDNPSRQSELLNQLGFTTYHKKAQSGDQEALINLLFQFKTNINAVRAEIVSKGTPDVTLDNICNHSDLLKDADISQEGNKGTRKVITAEAVTEFNKIYNKVISIAKIATKLYKDNPALKDQFSFNKISNALNKTRKTKTTPIPNPQT